MTIGAIQHLPPWAPSQAYSLLSVILAILAIVIVSSPYHYLLMAEVEMETEAQNYVMTTNHHDKNAAVVIASDEDGTIMG